MYYQANSQKSMNNEWQDDQEADPEHGISAQHLQAGGAHDQPQECIRVVGEPRGLQIDERDQWEVAQEGEGP